MSQSSGPEAQECQEFDQAVQAIICGDADALKKLLNEDPSLVQARSASGHRSTLLHYVAANGIEDELQKTPSNAVEIATVLLNAGADVNALAETYGGGTKQTTLNSLVTSVHPARAGVQAELAGLLIEAGAPVNGLEDDGSPLKGALFFGYTESAEVLVGRGARADTLFLAAGLGNLERMGAHFGSDGSLGDDDGLSPKEALEKAFIYARINDQTEAAGFLLDKGVDINAMPDGIHSNPCTGLHFASWKGHTGVAKLLIARGAELNARDPNIGATPLGWARHNGHEAVADLLTAAGAE